MMRDQGALRYLSANAVVVYVGGVFDLLHSGHINLLERAKALGDYLVVGLLTDEGAAAYKRKPILPYDVRERVVAALKVVDLVIPQSDTDPTLNGELQSIDPNILVHGDDWDKVGGQAWMEAKGRKTIFLPYTKGISTGEIIGEIKRRTF